MTFLTFFERANTSPY